MSKIVGEGITFDDAQSSHFLQFLDKFIYFVDLYSLYANSKPNCLKYTP